MSHNGAVLFINHSKFRCGVHMFGKEIAEQLSGSQVFDFTAIACNSLIEFSEVMTNRAPAAVVFNYHPTTMPWAPLAAALCRDIPTVGIAHDVTSSMADAWPDVSFDAIITHDPDLHTSNPLFVSAPRPIPQYLPKAKPSQDGVVRIGSFGFAAPDKGFDDIVRLSQEAFDRCIIRLHIPPSDFGDPEGINARALVDYCRTLVQKPGVEIEASHGFMERNEVIDFLASNDINALFYDSNRGAGGISSAADWLFASGRPMALRRGKMFRNFDRASPPIYIDDLPLRQIYENGTTPLDRFRATWAPSGVVAAYELAAARAIQRRKAHATLARQAIVLDAGLNDLRSTIDRQSQRICELEKVFHLLQGQKEHGASQILELNRKIAELGASSVPPPNGRLSRLLTAAKLLARS